MYEANIKKQHLDIYEERLRQIKPILDRARSIICSNNKTVLKNIYITGGCAAWLIGRTDTFNDIHVFLLNQSETSVTYKTIYKEYMNCKDTSIVLTRIEDIPISAEPTSRNCLTIRDFTYKGTPSLRFSFTELDIHLAEKWISYFPELSVFINLYDLNEIRTGECRCSFESNCTVTQNGCVRHGRVVYPLSVDNSDSLPYLLTYVWVKSMDKILPSMTILRPISSFLCPTKLFTDHNLYEDRIMTFCEYSCCKCKDRDKLTKKYADIWWHKTYVPGGYGFKAAAQRFKKIDTDLFKQYCTCTSSNQVAKPQRSNSSN